VWGGGVGAWAVANRGASVARSRAAQIRSPHSYQLVAVEEAGRGDGEGAEAEANDKGATGMGLPESIGDFGWDGLILSPPARHDDDVGVGKAAEIVGSDQPQARFGPEHGVGDRRGDAEVDGRQALGRPVLAEDEARNGEVERPDAVKGEGGDDGPGHGPIVPIFSNIVNRATFRPRPRARSQRGQSKGDFHGQHRPRARRELLREDAGPRTDLEKPVLAPRRDRLDDLVGPGRRQEVLPESFSRGHAFSIDSPRQNFSSISSISSSLRPK